MKYIKLITIMIFLCFLNINAKEIIKLEIIDGRFTEHDNNLKNNPKYLLFSDRTLIINKNGKKENYKLSKKEFDQEIERIKKLFKYEKLYIITDLAHSTKNIIYIDLNNQKKEIVINGELLENYLEELIEERISLYKFLFNRNDLPISKLSTKEKEIYIENLKNILIKEYSIPKELLDIFLHYKNYKEKIILKREVAASLFL